MERVVCWLSNRTSRDLENTQIVELVVLHCCQLQISNNRLAIDYCGTSDQDLLTDVWDYHLRDSKTIFLVFYLVKVFLLV